jgi:NADPH2:quinone reductase
MIPKTMRAVVAREPGGPDVLTMVERPVPSPGPGEILIKVAAAGVNRPDMLQRQGHYPVPPGASDVLGLEVAGEVCALGEGVTLHNVGDDVMALIPGGGYAEYALAHESNALPVPQGLSMKEAAAIPETYFTVWTNVFDRGGLKAGEWFLVHGGSSGIGVTAIQLAHAFGAKVIATVGDERKAEACRKLGADIVVNYKTQDFVEEARKASGRGVDVILDMVGGDYVPRNYAAAAMDARIVQIAFLHGPKVELDLRPLMMKRLVHTGSTLRPRSPAEKAEIAEHLREKVWPLLEAGRCKPLIDSKFPLDQADKAHERMESSAHIGKIVLTI